MAPISSAQLAIIKATVPVLQSHGESITTTMYNNMIKSHPAMKDIFSHTSQITGAQPRALARAVLAYATYIDDLPKLTHAIERIAQKHASLFIQPGQYDIVGGHLIGAIQEVLGDAIATPAVVDAWTAAYGILAQVFIGREQQLYAADGNWTGWRKFRIARKVVEAEDIASFYLEPVDGVAPLPTFLPGQYISLQVPVPQLGHLQSRQFSLSHWTAGGGRQYRVTVKREKERCGSGSGDKSSVVGLVSNLLHESYAEGDTVDLSHPHGEFFLDPSDASKAGAPVILISAGVGATPLLSILHALHAQQPSAVVERPVSWVHTSRSSAAQPFAEEVASVLQKMEGRAVTHVHLRQGLSDDNGHNSKMPRLDVSTLDREATLFLQDRRAEYYVCGPESFMLDTRKKLVEMGVDKERVFLELFATGDVEDD
ncbi:hypothetical protein M406DRAFT_38042 [Cryphonectria parasitica EP155]|uniref:nitric oxide dioxygenase n=1 Tax=Cryphonectria parasitica (strain ATCC 38755 / EP155) TaxID=660469 RepID=A0A9P4Y2P3_CRYP1|nr:uncharacterized protein M406DRAFT_38042 [Cryphonectria parasitica EP155]KAF3765374.1 hypothetical protein M406DRAFT_38042 [Cryphonectria parasitica EP155]